MFKGKNYLWTLIQFLFMLVTTIPALLITAYNTINQVLTTPGLPIDKAIGNWLAGLIAIYLVIAALILGWDGLKAFQRFHAEAPAKAKA